MRRVKRSTAMTLRYAAFRLRTSRTCAESHLDSSSRHSVCASSGKACSGSSAWNVAATRCRRQLRGDWRRAERRTGAADAVRHERGRVRLGVVLRHLVRFLQVALVQVGQRKLRAEKVVRWVLVRHQPPAALVGQRPVYALRAGLAAQTLVHLPRGAALSAQQQRDRRDMCEPRHLRADMRARRKRRAAGRSWRTQRSRLRTRCRQAGRTQLASRKKVQVNVCFAKSMSVRLVIVERTRTSSGRVAEPRR